MEVSWNVGTPNHPFIDGFPLFFHPFWGTPMYGNPYHCTPIIRPYLPGGATEGTCLGRYSRELMWLPWDILRYQWDLMGYEWDLMVFNGISMRLKGIWWDFSWYLMGYGILLGFNGVEPLVISCIAVVCWGKLWVNYNDLTVLPHWHDGLCIWNYHPILAELVILVNDYQLARWYRWPISCKKDNSNSWFLDDRWQQPSILLAFLLGATGDLRSDCRRANGHFYSPQNSWTTTTTQGYIFAG